MKDELRERIGDYSTISPENPEFKFTCTGCGKCCHNRHDEQTILVSSYDMFRVLSNIKPENPTEFIDKNFGFYIGNNSGLVLAHLKTKNLMDGRNICVFLKNKDGRLRCSIHDFKPAACRLFPLGRIIAADEEHKIEYILQHDVSCNHGMSEEEKETHTIEEWIPDKEETEKAFMQMSDAINKIVKIVNLKEIVDSNKIDQKAKMLLYASIDMSLYRNYDYEKPFKEQFDSNIEALLEILKLFVESYGNVEKKIRPLKKNKK